MRRVPAGLGGLDDPVWHHSGHSAVSGHPTWTCPLPTSSWWGVGVQPTGLHDSEKVCQPLHGPKEVESGTSVVSRSSDERSGKRTAGGPTRAAHKGVVVLSAVGQVAAVTALRVGQTRRPGREL